MPHPCVVCGRSRMNPNNRAEEYIFFGFPVNDEGRCKKWLEFCCREELYKLTKKQLLQRMVCSKHFVSSDFLNDFYDRLNSTAVPSVYDPKQSLYNISCVLCGRFRKDPPGPDNDDATFHHFPGEEFRCLNWLDFVGVDSYYRLTRKEIMFCFICSKHFDTTQFVKGFHNRLVDGAVPNIKYPDENESKVINADLTLETAKANVEVQLFSFSDKNDGKINNFPATVLEGQECAACGRSRTDPNNKAQKFKFHPFPAYEIGRCLKWCQFLNREDILKMSPNQIRKMVLCSGHFQAGQNFNNGNGPCDAVPSIYDYDKDTEIVSISVGNEAETETETNKIARPAVSSKKPKIDPLIKPTPLAKKRGRSRRPTTINIPKITQKVESHIVQKVPIPTTNNWKLITNQLQPITISNNIVNNIAPDIKKVILPFSGNISNISNISNLGNPIPVNSLSSIPPGLLIKINLPEQNKNPEKPKRKRRRKATESIESEEINIVQNKSKSKGTRDNALESVPENNISEFLCYPQVASGVQVIKTDEEMQDDSYVNSYDEVEEEAVVIESNPYLEEVEDEIEVAEDQKPKLIKMSGRCRRTLIPIQSELRHFLNKIKPHVTRLPKRSKAQVKLAIVNMVIDQL